MNFDVFIDLVTKRLCETLPGRAAHEKMLGRVKNMPTQLPENARQSAVLCLLFPKNGELHVVLMKRMEDNTPHSGQVSFPGGRFEEEDIDFQATALREAQEEVGIKPTDVQVLGPLSSLYIPVSNFNVNPYLAYHASHPDYQLNIDEVRHVLEVPLSRLFAPDTKKRTNVVSPAIPNQTFEVNAYILPDNTIIWGATAMILSEIEHLLNELQP